MGNEADTERGKRTGFEGLGEAEEIVHSLLAGSRPYSLCPLCGSWFNTWNEGEVVGGLYPCETCILSTQVRTKGDIRKVSALKIMMEEKLEIIYAAALAGTLQLPMRNVLLLTEWLNDSD